MAGNVISNQWWLICYCHCHITPNKEMSFYKVISFDIDYLIPKGCLFDHSSIYFKEQLSYYEFPTQKRKKNMKNGLHI